MFFRIAQDGINGFWNYLLGVVVVMVCYFLGQIPMFIALYWALTTDDGVTQDDIVSFSENPNFELVGINTNFGFLLLLFMFIFAFIGLYFIVTKVHKRKFISTITPSGRIDFNRVVFGFSIWVVLGIIAEFVSYFMEPSAYSFHFALAPFIFLVLISLFLLPIQTSFEEIFFRGYLLQGFGLWAKNKWLPLIITSLLFASIHGLNPEIGQFGMLPMMIYYITAGLFLGIITIMDDRLELALGVHAAVNIYGALLVGYEGSAIQTDALFKTSHVNPWLMEIGLLVMGLVFLYISARKYNWKPFSVMFQTIEEDTYPLNNDIA